MPLLYDTITSVPPATMTAPRLLALDSSAAIVMLPAPLVMSIPSPALNVATVGSPLLSPIKSSPLPSTADAVIAPVPDPNKIPPSVSVVAPVPPFPTGRVPVTSAAKSTPPALIVTAPELTSKLSELNDATPLALVVASVPATVMVWPECVTLAPFDPANVNVSASRSTLDVPAVSVVKSRSAAVATEST